MLKNLTFPNDEFGKGQCAFYPIKLSPFAEKKQSSPKMPKFHKGGPLQTGLNASRPTKKIKSQTLFWSSVTPELKFLDACSSHVEC